jgi:ABC-type sugar transport system substrate-binding protein
MNFLSKQPKQTFLAALSLAVIAGCGAWIYFTQFAGPKTNDVLHIGVGQALAEETAKVLGGKGKIMVVTIDSGKFPDLKVQMDTFQKAIKKLGKIEVERTFTLETEEKLKYRTGAGLSGRRFLRIVGKSAEADAIVSFVGAPEITAEEAGSMKKWPKFIAEARSPDKLKGLFEKKLIQVAVVSRFEFPSPGPARPRTSAEWFTNRFQVITESNASSLP